MNHWKRPKPPQRSIASSTCGGLGGWGGRGPSGGGGGGGAAGCGRRRGSHAVTLCRGAAAAAPLAGACCFFASASPFRGAAAARAAGVVCTRSVFARSRPAQPAARIRGVTPQRDRRVRAHRVGRARRSLRVHGCVSRGVLLRFNALSTQPRVWTRRVLRKWHGLSKRRGGSGRSQREGNTGSCQQQPLHSGKGKAKTNGAPWLHSRSATNLHESCGMLNLSCSS